MTGRVYAVMTKNKKHHGRQAQPGQHAAGKPLGPYRRDDPARRPAPRPTTRPTPTPGTFSCWPATRRTRARRQFHPMTSENGWFVTPDNLTFDPKGRMFVATDGANDFDIARWHLWRGNRRPGARPAKLLFACPTGAEATGPCFTPDGTTLFVSVQHPGEDSSRHAACRPAGPISRRAACRARRWSPSPGSTGGSGELIGAGRPC